MLRHTQLRPEGHNDGLPAVRPSAHQLRTRGIHHTCFCKWSKGLAECLDQTSHSGLMPVCRTTWLLHTIVSNGKPILLVGESGTAKSVTINNYLASLDGAVNLVLNMNFSSRTSSMDVQVQIGWPLLQLWCAFSLSLHCFCESVGNQVL